MGVIKVTELANMLIEDERALIAKKLLKRGISISAIAEDTGLDVHSIEGLQEELRVELDDR